MQTPEETVTTLALRSGKSQTTVRRLIRTLEQTHKEKILVVKPGCTTNLEVDMAAFERCIAKSRTGAAPEAKKTKPRRRRRGAPLPGQLPLF